MLSLRSISARTIFNSRLVISELPILLQRYVLTSGTPDVYPDYNNVINNLIKLICNKKDDSVIYVMQNIEINETVFMHACKSGLTKIVRIILRKYKHYATYIDMNGYTPLLFGCRYKDIVIELLNYGCKTIASPSGNTPLMEACNSYACDSAMILIDKCDTAQVNNVGDTALLIACRHRLNDIAMKLLDTDCNLTHAGVNGSTSLMIACSNNLLDVVTKILTMDCNPGYVCNRGYTALMIACVGHPEIAMKLIKTDCNPSQVNMNGNTALFYACDWKLHDVAMKLLEFNYNNDHINSYGDTPLIAACRSGLRDVAMKLLESDCNPGQINDSNNTALIHACNHSLSDVALKLITMDCKPRHINNFNQSALTFAIGNNLSNVVEELKRLLAE